MSDKPIDAAEARRILENLARNGPPTAQVAALRALREMDTDERAAAAEAEWGRTGDPTFDALYDATDDLTARRPRRPGQPAGPKAA
jgi:hypothetical protein